jgi:hypothetical protein
MNATPNPTIERTPYGTLRVPSVAAHVERWAVEAGIHGTNARQAGIAEHPGEQI